ncbi:MAG TPA: hypothetical protein VM370_13170 [Candidatus Thermoplasmatota archaeon]|nr:hypothetical protein [Candidatus Thermoplasmatota archaeon]
MADFEMLSSERVEFNQGGEFLELSINLVKDGNRETPYLRLARGFYGSDGEPRYKKGGCTLPIDREVIVQLSDALKAWDISEAEKRKGAGAAAAAAAPAKKAAAKKKPAADEDDE